MKKLYQYINEALIRKNSIIKTETPKISKEDFLKTLSKYDICTSQKIQYIIKHDIDFVKVFPKGYKQLKTDVGWVFSYPSIVLYLSDNGFEDQRTFIYGSTAGKKYEGKLNISILTKDNQEKSVDIADDNWDKEGNIFLYTENNMELLSKGLKKYL